MGMPFGHALDDIFDNDDFAVDALYTPPGGAPVGVRVIYVSPKDVLSRIEGTVIESTGTVLDLRASDVAVPVAGAVLVLDDTGTSVTVQGKPYFHQVTGVWTLSTYPNT